MSRRARLAKLENRAAKLVRPAPSPEFDLIPSTVIDRIDLADRKAMIVIAARYGPAEDPWGRPSDQIIPLAAVLAGLSEAARARVEAVLRTHGLLPPSPGTA